MADWKTKKKDQEYHLVQSAKKNCYTKIVAMPYLLQKKILREFAIDHQGMTKNKVINAKPYILA